MLRYVVMTSGLVVCGLGLVAGQVAAAPLLPAGQSIQASMLVEMVQYRRDRRRDGGGKCARRPTTSIPEFGVICHDFTRICYRGGRISKRWTRQWYDYCR